MPNIKQKQDTHNQNKLFRCFDESWLTLCKTPSLESKNKQKTEQQEKKKQYEGRDKRIWGKTKDRGERERGGDIKK